ncbi:ATP-binding protein [Candidatus Woesearchaeota archaeon]|nr:ATP-binding protein [Candidatus Woesearchaeota archaeon]
MYEIIIGRSEADRVKFNLRGTVFLGKHYVKMGQTTSLSSSIYLDVNRSHVVFVVGKRGSGKSYSLGVIAEGISNLPKETAENLSVIIFDTMGIFWTMKYPNIKDR